MRSQQNRDKILRKLKKHDYGHGSGEKTMQLVPKFAVLLLGLYLSAVAYRYVTTQTDKVNGAHSPRHWKSLAKAFQITHSEALRLWETQLSMVVPFYSIIKLTTSESIRKSLYTKLIIEIVTRHENVPVFVKSSLLTVVLVCIILDTKNKTNLGHHTITKPFQDMANQATLMHLAYRVKPIVICLLTTKQLTLKHVNTCLAKIL